jgi:hypothetical protein
MIQKLKKDFFYLFFNKTGNYVFVVFCALAGVLAHFGFLKFKGDFLKWQH